MSLVNFTFTFPISLIIAIIYAYLIFIKGETLTQCTHAVRIARATYRRNLMAVFFATRETHLNAYAIQDLRAVDRKILN